MFRGLAITLVIAGLFLFGWAVYDIVDRDRHQAVEQQQLEASLRTPPSATAATKQTSGAARARERASAGQAWGRLEIPRVGLSVVVDEGIDSRTLRRAVGHVPGTSFPGEPGNVVLAGHRDSLFRPLRLVQDGDRMSVRTPDGEFTYEVTSLQIVAPERTDVLVPGAEHELTLVTCYPFYYVGPAPQRFVVKARVIAADAGGSKKEGGGRGAQAFDLPPSTRPGF